MIRKNVPVSKEERGKKRNRWPFKDMIVGDVIDVELANEWHEAQKYAHTYADKKGWKITANWLPDEDLGRIRRLK